MIPYQYLARYTKIPDPEGFNETKIVFDTSPLEPGFIYRVTAVIESPDKHKAIVQWELEGPGGESVRGEILFVNLKPVELDGGALDLHIEPEEFADNQLQSGVWGRIDNRMGKYGIPQCEAKNLRSFKNRRGVFPS